MHECPALSMRSLYCSQSWIRSVKSAPASSHGGRPAAKSSSMTHCLNDSETTGQLSMQLSLLDSTSAITFLFDAAGDADAAAVLRRQVPALGLKGKLFGTTPDAALLWRAADVIVARPRPEVVSRVMLVGGRLVAVIDDAIANGPRVATALEARNRALAGLERHPLQPLRGGATLS